MRRGIKRFAILCTAAAFMLGALTLGACDNSFQPLKGDYTSATAAVSNGGFVVEYGNFVYFINGVETYTSDNTYGNVKKGALMRIAKTDLYAGENKAETVVPSLMVAGDYEAGIFIYGDRVYYATPNNVKNTSGAIENDYLDFKSAKLDGSDIKSYFRVSDNASSYRFVKVGETVYLMYAEGTTSSSTLHSYNTATETDTVLAKGATGYKFNDADKTDPYIYYTMDVSIGLDIEDGTQKLSYNQIYRVRADATEAPYEYKWNQEYLDKHDGEAPYLNLGEIVLDGVMYGGIVADQFTHETEIPAGNGYTYSLLKNANGGVYFTRNNLAATQSPGDNNGWLYYLSGDQIGADNWNSVKGNADVTTIAQNTTKASESAIFYIDGGEHYYLYTNNNNIFRAKVGASGIAEETVIARGVSPTLMYRDDSDSVYDYVYYTQSHDSALSVERAVTNGSAEDYSVLQGDENYQNVAVLDLHHANNWYKFEVVSNMVFFADAETLNSASYNYVSTVNLRRSDGTMMTNTEIEALNEKYEKLTDSNNGVFAKITSDVSQNASMAVRYYFSTGVLTQFEKNIEDAVSLGRSETSLYSEDEKKIVREFAEGKGDYAPALKDENGVSFRTMSYFVTRLGVRSQADEDAIAEYWRLALRNYTPEETETGLAAWQWALIGIAIGVAVIGAGVAVILILRKRQIQQRTPKAQKLQVDLTDDQEIDVYGYASDEAEPKQEVAEETAETVEPAPEAETDDVAGEEAGESDPEQEQTEAPAPVEEGDPKTPQDPYEEE